MEKSLELQQLETILTEVSEFLRTKFNTTLQITQKGVRDPVTDVDIAAEELIVQRLEKLFPKDSMLTEETHSVERGKRTWVIDPIDGTVNFTQGIPHFCISIALIENEDILLAGIADPCKGEIFLAEKNKGATLNGHKISVSNTKTLIQSLLATGFPYGRNEIPNQVMAPFNALIFEIKDIRRFGSAALDLAWVAAGRFDGFWELNLNPWDCAAGVLLIQEAGGKVTDEKGDLFSIFHPWIIASNGKIHPLLEEKITEILK